MGGWGHQDWEVRVSSIEGELRRSDGGKSENRFKRDIRIFLELTYSPTIDLFEAGRGGGKKARAREGTATRVV